MTDLLVPDETQTAVVEDRRVRFPLVEVLRPRQHASLLGLALAVSLAAAWWTRVRMDRPLWHAVAIFLVLMAGPLSIKWRADAQRFGLRVAVAGALLTVQSLHGVEHAFQWYQRHVLGLPLRQSNGLLSPANTEWVHFVWNWLVLFAVTYLVIKGMRGWFAALFVIWVVAHTLEHSYMMIRYVQVGGDLDRFGFPDVTAQGLPGVVGRDGWLDRNAASTPLAFVCNIPFATTATRLDAHAMWNVGETLLMLPAIHVFLRRALRVSDADRAQLAIDPSARLADHQLDG